MFTKKKLMLSCVGMVIGAGIGLITGLMFVHGINFILIVMGSIVGLGGAQCCSDNEQINHNDTPTTQQNLTNPLLQRPVLGQNIPPEIEQIAPTLVFSARRIITEPLSDQQINKLFTAQIDIDPSKIKEDIESSIDQCFCPISLTIPIPNKAVRIKSSKDKHLYDGEELKKWVLSNNKNIVQGDNIRELKWIDPMGCERENATFPGAIKATSEHILTLLSCQQAVSKFTHEEYAVSEKSKEIDEVIVKLDNSVLQQHYRILSAISNRSANFLQSIDYDLLRNIYDFESVILKFKMITCNNFTTVNSEQISIHIEGWHL